MIEFNIRQELITHTNKIIQLLSLYEDKISFEATTKVPETSNPLNDLKILCVGQSTLNRNEIFDIFNDAFYKRFGQNIPKKSIDMPILEFKKMKTFDFRKRIKSDRYHYIISGPRPHSTANKGININLFQLKQHLNLKAITYDSIKETLNRNLLEGLAETISINYKENH